MTLEGWIYPKSYGEGDAGLIFYSDTCAMRLSGFTDHQLDFWCGFSPTGVWHSPVNSISTNVWQHVAVSYDASNTTNVPTFYINGIKQTLSTVQSPVGSLSTTAVTWVIGNRTNQANTFDGYIDDFKVYDYVRTPAQIAYDYNRGWPIAWYQFDECQGTAAYNAAIAGSGAALGNNGTITPGDSSGNNDSAGTCNSGAANPTNEMWNAGTTGKYNASLSFDGTNDYVNVGDPSDGSLDFGTGDFSISTWVNVPSGNGVVVSKGSNAGEPPGSGSGYYLYVASDRTIKAEVSSYDANSKWHDVQTTQAIPASTWTHLAFTKTTSVVNIYINGILQPVTTSADPIAQITSVSNTASFRVGSYTPLSLYATGQIDDVRAYNYALTAGQILKVYNESAGVRFGPNVGSP